MRTYPITGRTPPVGMTTLLDSGSPRAIQEPVGWGFIVLYTLALMSSSLMLIAPLLVTLALKLNDLVGTDRAPRSLALVASTGAFLSIFANPLFGSLSDRTTSRFGMRRPWMLAGYAGGSLGILVVASAPNVTVVLVGWCLAQVFFNALLAVQVAVLPDQVPPQQRGLVSGLLGICTPVASVCGTYLVKAFAGSLLAMFLVPCALGGVFIVLFAVVLNDRRTVTPRPGGHGSGWSLRTLLATFYVSPRQHPDFAWAFLSRFMFVMAYAFLASYQAFYLLKHLGSSEAQVPGQIFLATLVTSGVVVAASLTGGRLSDALGRRKIFVLSASAVYAIAMCAVALAGSFGVFLVAAALGGLGFGIYVAVDLALVTEVIPSHRDAAKDLGVFNVANALPFAVAPALAPLILRLTHGSYPALYAVAGVCALGAAAAISRVRGVR
jgi:MFS family permease